MKFSLPRTQNMAVILSEAQRNRGPRRQVFVTGVVGVATSNDTNKATISLVLLGLAFGDWPGRLAAITLSLCRLQSGRSPAIL
jgi:hypothetical protein